MKRLIALLPLAALALGACTTSPDPVSTAGPALTGAPSPAADPAADAAVPSLQPATTDDVDFLRSTISHQRQVMQRSGILVDLPDVPADVVDFARRQLETTGPLTGELNRLLADRRGGMGRQEDALRQRDRLELVSAAGEEAARVYVDQTAARIDELLPLAERATASPDADVQEMAQRIVEKLTAERTELAALRK